MVKYKQFFTEKRREFIARIICDLGKTVMGIALASYFFERFSWPVRILVCLLGPVFLFWSVFVEPAEKGVSS